MRLLPLLLVALPFSALAQPPANAPVPAAAETVHRLYAEALAHGQAYAQLRTLTAEHPARLSGSPALARSVDWAEQVLRSLPLDRVYRQEVPVRHWERGQPESVQLRPTRGEAVPLAAAALGNSGATPPGGLVAGVLEVRSLEELSAAGADRVAGRIVFFNAPMDPARYSAGAAYGAVGFQRSRGPAAAAALGAVGALTRSLTQAHDDFPHTGNTTFPPGVGPIPAAALSTVAADRLSAALAGDPQLRVALQIHARSFPDAPSHNVVGEIRGSEFPDEIILVGGHLDSWDLGAGAQDDGAGVVQSVEVLRLFRALGLRPRHTLRCVLFTNEENGLAGASAYASTARTSGERHLFAIESDGGGYAPVAFNLGSTQGDAHLRAARWSPLFAPWGVWEFRKGSAGADVAPLLLQGVTVAQIISDSQRYFDLHHTARDTIDQVNPRELHLGAAALAALVWLVDTEGL